MMDTIKTDEEYTTALEKLNALLDTEQLTPEQDAELDKLADMVEEYEGTL